MKQRLAVVFITLVVVAVSAFGGQYGYDRFIGEGAASSDELVPPTSINGGALAIDSILVVWARSASGGRVERYEVERDGNPIATTDLLSFVDLGLEPGTTYAYRVRAGDGTEWSEFTASVQLTTDVDAP